MILPIYLVDAFTDVPFAGNPAGVCLMDSFRDAEWMQGLAREMNQAETAFVVAREEGYSLRWFTPSVEVDLCGHATLAAAHVLWEANHLAPDKIARFDTRSGPLTAQRRGNWIELDFPTTPALPVSPPVDFEAILDAPIVLLGKSRFDYLVELADAQTVAALRPDLHQIARLDSRGLIVTARSADDACDFVSRFFAPQSGVDEDPVTGSAHCALGEYWMKKLGKSELQARQLSKRGGFLRVAVRGERTLLLGQALTTLRGEILL